MIANETKELIMMEMDTLFSSYPEYLNSEFPMFIQQVSNKFPNTSKSQIMDLAISEYFNNKLCLNVCDVDIKPNNNNNNTRVNEEVQTVKRKVVESVFCKVLVTYLELLLFASIIGYLLVNYVFVSTDHYFPLPNTDYYAKILDKASIRMFNKTINELMQFSSTFYYSPLF